MDHVGILKNAFRTTLRHRSLWVLGFLWALVGGGGSGFNFGGSSGYNFENGDMPSGAFGVPELSPAVIIAVMTLLCSVLLVVAVIATILRYTLQAGVYRSLHALDTTGAAPTVSGGFRQGWRRHTWRLLWQDLLVGIPLALAAMVGLALALSPLLLLFTEDTVASVIGVVGAVGLGLVWFVLLIAVVTVVGVLSQFWWRGAVIADEGVLAAISSAWRLARRNLGDVAIMWLLMVGAGLLWGILLFPIVLVLFAVVAALAVGPGILLYQATQSLAPALLWGVPVALLLTVLPLAFLGGFFLIFQASVWGQVYHQLRERTLAIAA